VKRREFPPIAGATRKDLERLVERGSALLPHDLADLLGSVVDLLEEVTKRVRARGATIGGVRRFLDLAGRKKLADLLASETSPAEAAAPPPPAGAEPRTDAPPEAGEKGAASKPENDGKGPKKKGHGRVPASAYGAAEHVAVPHEGLHVGDACPGCTGKLHRFAGRAPIVRVCGQAPLSATCWDPERLRCGGCGKVYTARAPEQAQGPKYDATAVSTIALWHYGAGMPFHRLERLQRNLQTPVPASTQWQIVSESAPSFRPVYQELARLAAQAPVLHNDDSHVRILEWMGKRGAKRLAKGELCDPERTGLFTTAIVAITADGPIALFTAGRQHAGENLEDLLSRRDPKLPAPIQMGDALTRNVPKAREVIPSNCLAHGLRKIAAELDVYPEECRSLLTRLSQVYDVDERCKKEKVSDEERLAAHQKESGPVMKEIRRFMEEQFEQKRIEPNSALGQAFTYLLKRWDTFTVFLRIPGAPLDNNICERALKMAIKHRNASLFYRNARGASVGDLYMSLLHTAELHGVNPFDYLTALQRHEKAVAETPSEWLPWNYRQTLARMGVNEALRPGPARVATPPPSARRSPLTRPAAA
jgi:transposase